MCGENWVQLQFVDYQLTFIDPQVPLGVFFFFAGRYFSTIALMPVDNINATSKLTVFVLVGIAVIDFYVCVSCLVGPVDVGGCLLTIDKLLVWFLFRKKSFQFVVHPCMVNITCVSYSKKSTQTTSFSSVIHLCAE